MDLLSYLKAALEQYINQHLISIGIRWIGTIPVLILRLCIVSFDFVFF